MFWKYFKYIIRHKYYVAIACFKRGLIWQGIIHDWTKFKPSEFYNYAVFFYGKGQINQKGDTISSGGNAELKNKMELSWLRHVHANKHHWNYWIVVDRVGEIQIFDMPYKYIVEMVCDWEGVGKAIRGKDANTIDWYERQKDTLMLSDNTRIQVESIIKD